MIIPDRITNTNRTDEELFEFFFFCVAVAGKTARTTAPKVNEVLSEMKSRFGGNIFEQLTYTGSLTEGLDNLEIVMRKHKLGKYLTMRTMMFELFVDSDDYDDMILLLRTATAPELERLYGVGPKTSRFFIMHSRANYPRMAILDTHILKFINEEGYLFAPKNTPSNMNTYLAWESVFLELYDDYVNKKGFEGGLADFDLRIWVYYSEKWSNRGYVTAEQFLRLTKPEDFSHDLTRG